MNYHSEGSEVQGFKGSRVYGSGGSAIKLPHHSYNHFVFEKSKYCTKLYIVCSLSQTFGNLLQVLIEDKKGKDF